MIYVQIVLTMMVVMSCIGFILMGKDKQSAKKHQWRIPESTLLWVAFLMGGIGSWIGMKVFHHKTKHMKFQVLVPVFAMLQVVLLAYVYVTYAHL